MPSLMTNVTATELLCYASHGVKHMHFTLPAQQPYKIRYYFHVTHEQTGTERVSNLSKFIQVQWLMNTGVSASRTQALLLVPGVESGSSRGLEWEGVRSAGPGPTCTQESDVFTSLQTQLLQGRVQSLTSPGC